MDIEWRGRHKLAIPRDGKREKSIWDQRSIWVTNSAVRVSFFLFFSLGEH